MIVFVIIIVFLIVMLMTMVDVLSNSCHTTTTHSRVYTRKKYELKPLVEQLVQSVQKKKKVKKNNGLTRWSVAGSESWSALCDVVTTYCNGCMGSYQYCVQCIDFMQCNNNNRDDATFTLTNNSTTTVHCIIMVNNPCVMYLYTGIQPYQIVYKHNFIVMKLAPQKV